MTAERRIVEIVQRLAPLLPTAHTPSCERRQQGPQVCTCGYADVQEQQALLDYDRAAVR